MTDQLATIDPKQPLALNSRGVQLATYDEMKAFARDIANSGLAPKDLNTPERILVALQHGMELGLSPAQALQSIAVINGRPVLFGDAVLALVKAHPECDDVIESFEKGDSEEGMTAICTVQRTGKQPVTRKFTVAMAKKANLWGKAGPWTQYAPRMLQMRARSWALRDSFPDALKGVGIREEVQDTEPKPVHGRVVATGLVLPDDPLTLSDARPVSAGESESARRESKEAVVETPPETAATPSEAKAERQKPTDRLADQDGTSEEPERPRNAAGEYLF